MTTEKTLPPLDGGLAAEPATWRRWAALGVLSMALLTVVMDLTILNVALPILSTDLRPSATQQLWIIDAYSLVLAGLLVSMSALADRWGRRRLLMAGFAVFGAASFLVLWANSPAEVIALRVLLGVGGAMIMPTTLSMLRVVFTDNRERTLALGVWAAVSAAGAAIGPVIAGLLLEHFSWHSAFLVNVPPMVICLIAAALILPESRVADTAPIDILAAALSIVGMASLVWSIKEFGKHFTTDGLANPAAWTALVVAVITLTWFVRRCLSRRDPLLDVRLFLRPQLTAGVLTALFAMLAMGAGLLLVAQWLQLVAGHTALEAGIRLLPFAGGALITSLLAQRAVDAVGARFVVSGGLWLAAAGFVLFFVAPEPLTYSWVAAAMLLLGAGAGSLAIASAMIMSGSPQRQAGNAAAIEETAYDIGNVLGVALLGTIAAASFADRVGEAGGADQSLAAAVEIGESTGDMELITRATTAFTDALAQVGLVGAILLAAAGGLVFALTPRNVDIDVQH
uniref:MFS transporter n=1 Tax=Gordonia sp. B7-2 TaxID=3420932 RepID=UPI003D8E69FD